MQYTIRLLLPPGSLLLDHDDVTPYLGAYDPDRATYQWRSADPAMDELHPRLAALVEERLDAGDSIADGVRAARAPKLVSSRSPSTRTTPKPVPRLTEPWFCCAEPTAAQLAPLAP